MTYVIREMKQEDIHAVQSVAKIVWHDTYEGIIPREIQDSFLDEAYSDEKMKYRLENTHLFVAEEEGEVIGFANFSPVRLQNEAELGSNLFVTRSTRERDRKCFITKRVNNIKRNSETIHSCRSSE